MVDVQFPNTNQRLPVEDLQIINPEFDPFVAPTTESIPGGVGTDALVPTGSRGEVVPSATRLASRVCRSFLQKKAIYWADVGRKYRCTRSEHNSGQYRCPRCLEDEVYLRRTVYKREDGRSVRLLGCPSCLFLIREGDILADHCASPEEFEGI